MKHPFLLAGALGFAGIVAGSAMTYVDSIAGPGTAKASVGYGVDNAAGLGGEAASAVPKVVAEVAPALKPLAGAFSGALGGATAPTVPPANEGPDPDAATGTTLP